MLKQTVITGLILTAMAFAQVQAEPFNQPRHLKVDGQAKVSRVIAKSRVIARQAKENDSGKPTCGADNNGVIVDRNLRGESVVVVTKDIVNTGGNVEIGRDCE
jgi:hypothetical protein